MRSARTIVAALAVLVCASSALDAQTPDGAAVFARNCASCHNGVPENRAPSPDVLKQRSPEAILSALTAGGMRPQGGRLSGAERRAVAEYLTGRSLGSDLSGTTIGRCASPAPLAATSAASWQGWSPSNGNTRFQSTAQAGLAAADVPKLTLKWAFGFPDVTSAWSQPTIFGGRLFVGSQNGSVYALDAKSGCVIWTFAAKAGVRTAPIVGARENGGYTIYFGDTGANVYALDASSGQMIWSLLIDEHPFARITGTPTFYRNRLYVPVSSLEETAASQPGYACCSFRGNVAALDASTGKIVWRTYTVPEPQVVGKTAAGVDLLAPSGGSIWSSPTIDARRNIVYVTTGNTYSGATSQPLTDAVLALDMATGSIKWSKQMTTGDVFGCRAGTANCTEKAGPDFDFGTPAMLTTMQGGREILVVGQKSGMAYGLDPDKDGAVLWEYRAGVGSIWGGIQWGVSVDDQHAYLPVSDIRNPKPGGLHAVSLFTGEREWYQEPPPLKCAAGPTCNAALISPTTLIPGVLFSGSNDGAIRAHATKDGSIIWEFDTNREFLTLNGIRARGGAIQGAGPAIAGGMVYVNAGYGDHMGRPGNVLLAFGVD